MKIATAYTWQWSDFYVIFLRGKKHSNYNTYEVYFSALNTFKPRLVRSAGSLKFSTRSRNSSYFFLSSAFRELKKKKLIIYFIFVRRLNENE